MVHPNASYLIIGDDVDGDLDCGCAECPGAGIDDFACCCDDCDDCSRDDDDDDSTRI